MAQSVPSIGNGSSRSTHHQDVRRSTLVQPVHVAEYLCRRLFEVGIRAVHGVAGDCNHQLVDYFDHCGLSWVANGNALNAGYAADGYARIKGISALSTSSGVGEISALAAIAGAHAEYVPIVHIVGVPSPHPESHVIGFGNGNASTDLSRSVSCAAVCLNDPWEVPYQIDHAIRECWIQSRPVYISLPTDMAHQEVEGSRLRTPIDLTLPPNDPEKEDYVVDVILRYLHASKNAVVLVDAGAIRHRALIDTHDLIERSGLPTFVSPMGKGAVNEALANFCGVFAGDASDTEVRERVETADLVLSVGAMLSDFSTSSFNYRLSDLSTIDIFPNKTRVKYSEYPDLHMTGILRKLNERLGPVSIVPGPSLSTTMPHPRRDTKDEITAPWLWKYITRWLAPNDIVLTETGAPNAGIRQTRFPPNVVALNQTLRANPGYALPATQGAALAAQELMRLRPGRRLRTICFTTASAFHPTAQELSTIIRLGLTPVIFLIADQATRWRYKDLIPAFGASKGAYQTCSVQTKKQVQALLADEGFCEAGVLQFVEVKFGGDEGRTGWKGGPMAEQRIDSAVVSASASASASARGSGSTLATRLERS